MPELLTISSANERDLDLLFLEEAVASPSFLSWLLAAIGLSDGSLEAAERSVPTETGESDIELTVRSHSCLTKVLIENKVDAPLQPRQSERYAERAQGYVNRGLCAGATTVLAAPAAYFADPEDSLGFEHAITYERVLEWFEGNSEMGERRRYKVALLRAAILRGERGWKCVPDKTVTEFCRAYWEFARDHFPELGMREPPRERPASSGFVLFKPLALPPGVELRHDFKSGRMNLLLAGRGQHLAELRAQYQKELGNMQLDRAGKSAAVRASVPTIDMSAGFLASEAKVNAALEEARTLISWHARVFGPGGAP